MNPLSASLARMLAKAGQDIILRRLTNGPAPRVASEVTCRAHVRDYAPSELGGTIAQGDSHVIIGMTEIDRWQWPGGFAARIGGRDESLPRKGDQVVIDGRPRMVESAVPKHVGGEVVRVDMLVRGT